MRLLDRVAAASREVGERKEALEAARVALEQAIREAHSEGIPAATIARAAGLSRQRVAQLVSERP